MPTYIKYTVNALEAHSCIDIDSEIHLMSTTQLLLIHWQDAAYKTLGLCQLLTSLYTVDKDP